MMLEDLDKHFEVLDSFLVLYLFPFPLSIGYCHQQPVSSSAVIPLSFPPGMLNQNFSWWGMNALINLSVLLTSWFMYPGSLYIYIIFECRLWVYLSDVWHQKCYSVTHLNILAKWSQIFTKTSENVNIGLLSWLKKFVGAHTTYNPSYLA